MGRNRALVAIRRDDQPLTDASDTPRLTGGQRLSDSPSVTGIRVASMLCVQLFTTRSTVGGLNLYSTKIDAFTLAAPDGDRGRRPT
jgi:hypothetical protein